MINLPCFFNLSKSSSKPMTKRRKYIPSWAKKLNSGEEVIEANGLYIAREKPKIRAAKIHGTLIFSTNLPIAKVNRNTIVKNMNKFIIIIYVDVRIICII